MTDSIERKGYFLAIEWDGQKPPTTWYSTLARYGLSTGRGNKDESPISRRASDSGVAFQEGAIVVNSDSLARRLASEATTKGAKSVMIGVLDMKYFQMTPNDVEALTRITEQTSKRGPKSKEDEGRYIIMCYEEGETFAADLREKPLACPHCGGLRIDWWRGELPQAPAFDCQSMDVSKYWLATRFDANGRFSIPRTNASASLPDVPDMDAWGQGLKNQINLTMHFLKNFAEVIDGDGVEILHAMDLAYALQELPDTVRQTQRIAALQEYYAGSNDPKDYQMRISPIGVDLVDVSGMDGRFIKKL